jgi:two-component system chemotaxis response regulator CheY
MGKLNILVVDDSAVMRKIVVKTIKETGLDIENVSEAGNGKEGLEKMKSDSPDIVFSDWNMPEMNGIEMVEAARKEFKLKDIPIIMVTTEANIEKIKQARAAGANGYVTKPFTADKMKDKIAQVVKKLEKQ